jgi:hypothetical protein
VVIRTSRRRFVASTAAGLAALLVAGNATTTPAEATPPPAPEPTPAPLALVTFPPDVDDLGARLAYLAGLVAKWEYRAARGDERAAALLASLNRCLDLPINCLDGTALRRRNAA